MMSLSPGDVLFHHTALLPTRHLLCSAVEEVLRVLRFLGVLRGPGGPEGPGGPGMESLFRTESMTQLKVIR